MLLAVLVLRRDGGPSAAAPDAARIGSFLVRLAGPSVVQRTLTSDMAAGGAAALRSRMSSRQDLVLAAADAVALAQAPVATAIERLGGRIVSRYTTTANGFLVHATASQVAAIGRLAGVAGVERAPRLRPQLRQSVPFVGATALGTRAGYHGEDAVIAIVDTGIDYTHADFGGPGTPDAYAAAAADSTRSDELWQGTRLFPTAKVVGGWDFVGPNYSSPSGCTPDLEAAGKCTTTPHPDPDPLDQYGHGSHVAGIAAGLGTPRGSVSPGVAPGASLVALKIYGPPQPGVYVDEATDVVIDAIEWCARVNLGLPVAGTAPARVDAINMSLGEDWGQGSQLFDEAVAAATSAGIVVVAAAGNSGDRPYIVNAPGSSPAILSVANSAPPGAGIRMPARWAGGDGTFTVVEARFTPLLRNQGRIEAGLVDAGDACVSGAIPEAVRGRVALVAGGGCADDAKVAAVGQAGALAALVAAAGTATPMYGTATVSIPALSVAAPDAALLRTQLAAGEVSVTLDADADIGADAINVSSARGPSRHGALKPDLSAPGSGIVSAGYATGDAAANSSGTSMAAPHVAGAAALLAQRNRAERLGLGALDLAALLMNYARPVVYTASGNQRTVVPAARQGAGRLDVAAAGAAQVLVRAGDIASANFGHVALRAGGRLTLPLRLRNLGAEPLRLRPVARFWSAEDSDRGVEFAHLDDVTLPPHGTAMLPFGLDVAPGRLRDWTLRGQQTVAVAALTRLELDGDVTLTPLGEDGLPLAGAVGPHVPFYVLPRAAASAWAEALVAPSAEEPGSLRVTNQPERGADAAALPGRVELFPLPRGATQSDSADATGELDVSNLALRFDAAAGADADRLTFAVVLRRPAVQPQRSSYELYLDTNRDGLTDWRVRSLTEDALMPGGLSDKVVVSVTQWDGATGGPIGAERAVGRLAAEMHARIVLLSVPLSALGLSVPPSMDFYLVHRGLTEDWPAGAATDVVPDGGAVAGGSRYFFDATQTGWWPRPASLVLAPDEAREVALGTGLAPPGLLALYPDNLLESVAQVQVVQPGGAPPGPAPWSLREGMYLPMVLRDAR